MVILTWIMTVIMDTTLNRLNSLGDIKEDQSNFHRIRQKNAELIAFIEDRRRELQLEHDRLELAAHRRQG
jgi:hypothetical protein